MESGNAFRLSASGRSWQCSVFSDNNLIKNSVIFIIFVHFLIPSLLKMVKNKFSIQKCIERVIFYLTRGHARFARSPLAVRLGDSRIRLGLAHWPFLSFKTEFQPLFFSLLIHRAVHRFCIQFGELKHLYQRF